jgi:tetratricopeptide (TPR) repeat protein
VLLMRPDLDPIKMALETAERAVADDPLNPIVHREVGNTLVYLDRLDEAVSLLETAVSLGPHHADILFNYADGLTHIGRNEDARAAIDKAFALNPLPPDLYYWISAMIDYALNRYPSASVALRKMKQPESAARVIAAVEAMNGNLDEARRQRDIYMARHPMFRLADYKMPQRSREDREHYLAGLRLAGFT